MAENQAERRRNAERASRAQAAQMEREREYSRMLLAAQERGGMGTAHSKLDEYTPNVYLPTAQVLAALNELPDTVMSRYFGDEDAAARLEGQPLRALEASRSMRDVGEAVIGPEEILASVARLASGEGGGGDVFNVASVGLPLDGIRQPLMGAARQFVVDPARNAARRVRSAFSSAPEVADLAVQPVDITRDELLQSLSVGRLRDTPAAPVSARGVHYSRVEDLARTDPSFYGTGHIGSERQMVRREGLPDRTYFYVEGADGTPPTPEEPVAQRAPYQYEADLQGLYDVNADPEGLVALANRYNPEGTAIPDLERLIQQYGYSGYLSDFAPSWAPQSRRAAVMFEPVNVRRMP